MTAEREGRQTRDAPRFPRTRVATQSGREKHKHTAKSSCACKTAAGVARGNWKEISTSPPTCAIRDAHRAPRAPLTRAAPRQRRLHKYSPHMHSHDHQTFRVPVNLTDCSWRLGYGNRQRSGPIPVEASTSTRIYLYVNGGKDRWVVVHPVIIRHV